MISKKKSSTTYLNFPIECKNFPIESRIFWVVGGGGPHIFLFALALIKKIQKRWLPPPSLRWPRLKEFAKVDITFISHRFSLTESEKVDNWRKSHDNVLFPPSPQLQQFQILLMCHVWDKRGKIQKFEVLHRKCTATWIYKSVGLGAWGGSSQILTHLKNLFFSFLTVGKFLIFFPSTDRRFFLFSPLNKFASLRSRKSGGFMFLHTTATSPRWSIRN